MQMTQPTAILNFFLLILNYPSGIDTFITNAYQSEINNKCPGLFKYPNTMNYESLGVAPRVCKLLIILPV